MGSRRTDLWGGVWELWQRKEFRYVKPLYYLRSVLYNIKYLNGFSDPIFLESQWLNSCCLFILPFLNLPPHRPLEFTSSHEHLLSPQCTSPPRCPFSLECPSSPQCLTPSGVPLPLSFTSSDFIPPPLFLLLI